ncbi:MAG: PSD1 domain-containing protein, partial [Planctomycetes bacterium]|nr:PSD1 domain-containing protein [Planctomycetota bacterium]
MATRVAAEDAHGSAAAKFFDHRVAPILASYCLECHSGAKPKGGLDLSSRRTAMKGGENGLAIQAGKPAASLLWERVRSGEMPPKEELPKTAKQTLRKWIAAGAHWGTDPIDPFRFTTTKRAGLDWWSLQPLAKPPVPPVDGDSDGDNWSRNEIDRFIIAKLRAKGLAPSPRADPRTLVRRIYYNLIGLPAPLEAIDKFTKDPSPKAWGQLVDELLASKHYGERWARHWLDVVRFGESHGFEYNQPRENAWHYRAWVIRSLNRDLPYDQFARMHLAGDAIQPNSLEGAAAVGFLVAGTHNSVLGASPAMKLAGRHDELEEMAGTVAQTFLGLTVNCARCHDHKFDPISTREYYRFIAALDGVQHGERKVRSIPAAGAVAVFSVVSGNPGAMHVLLRGDVTRPGDEVAPGGIKAVRNVSASFGIDKRAADTLRRRALADWISHRDNGPFHRVVVNRVWHYHFGKGIVDTPSDLGFNGGRPSHAKLLEWLAVWFRHNGYSLKKLHKLIVTSATYQQASRSNPKATKIDKENRLLWRQNARRVEAEVLRDSILDVAGQLNREQFGPGYRDVKVVEVPPAFYYLPVDPIGKQFNRRTIYRWNVRGQRSALLDTFDCPDPSVKTPKRSVTTTPSQALSQWNDAFVLR